MSSWAATNVVLVLLQVKSMEPSQPGTLPTPPTKPVSRPPSARLVEKSAAAVQNNARAMTKACNRAGAGAAVKGVKASRTGEAAGSRGVGRTPGGTSKPKSAVEGLAPATSATGPKQRRKAEPQKAAAADAEAGADAAMPHRDQEQQEVQGCGGRNTFMAIAPDFVQFVSPKKLAPAYSGGIHCNRLPIPKHVVGWYPGIQHGSPLHLQVKVPAAAEELALRGGTCSLELGGARSSLEPVDEAPLGFGGLAQSSVHTKLVLALLGTLTVFRSTCCVVGPQQTLDHLIGWRIVRMQKVSFDLNMA